MTTNLFNQCKIYEEFCRTQVIPNEGVHLGKKVLTVDQGGNGVLLRFSDASEAESDILIGANGAFSAVHQDF
ncbi:hypothetical protein BGZ95_003680 [Linnemannia exigua]|uniref:Uncharacterized protein n=1 Tax=Linnemannia exigua TaxID=604196 RepID=A0AAD4D3Z1_9FUNG|nr:hypothetical protein BGZ95_003680 [Linnemannia exigua]